MDFGGSSVPVLSSTPPTSAPPIRNPNDDDPVDLTAYCARLSVRQRVTCALVLGIAIAGAIVAIVLTVGRSTSYSDGDGDPGGGDSMDGGGGYR